MKDDLTPTQKDKLRWIPFNKWHDPRAVVRKSTLDALERLGYIEKKIEKGWKLYRRLK